jgi:hypothetical protein
LIVVDKTIHPARGHEQYSFCNYQQFSARKYENALFLVMATLATAVKEECLIFDIRMNISSEILGK